MRVPLPAAMITMFSAMRASTAKAAIIGLCSLCLLLLQGCSAVRIGYNQAPTLAWWWVDGYMDFNTEQAPRVKDALNQWFAWHRKTQLPEYAKLLATAQVQVLQPATPEQVCRWSDELRALIGRAIDQGVPLAADVLSGLTAEQLAHLERKYRSRTRSSRRTFFKPRPTSGSRLRCAARWSGPR